MRREEAILNYSQNFRTFFDFMPAVRTQAAPVVFSFPFSEKISVRNDDGTDTGVFGIRGGRQGIRRTFSVNQQK